MPVRAPLCHIVSALCGILSLYSLLGVNAVYTCAIAISTYFAVIFCFRGRAAHGLSYRIVAILMFAYLLIRCVTEIFYFLCQVESLLTGAVFLAGNMLKCCQRSHGNRYGGSI